MASVPSRRRPTRWPVTSSSSAAKEPNRATASRLMRSSAPSPNRASETGASIPAATSDAASPWSGSTRMVSSPAAAARQAIAVPMTPPPATTTSAVTAKEHSLRRHYPDQVRRSEALGLPLSPFGLPWSELSPNIHLISAGGSGGSGGRGRAPEAGGERRRQGASAGGRGRAPEAGGER